MSKWYAVYTGEGAQAYSDGFTEIEAPTYDIAVRAFRAFHQDGENKTLPCGEILRAADFRLFSHSEKMNTWGDTCRERIYARHLACDMGGDVVHELISYIRTRPEDPGREG